MPKRANQPNAKVMQNSFNVKKNTGVRLRNYVFKCNATKVTELHGSSKSSPTEFYEACIATVKKPLATYIYLYISYRYVHTVLYIDFFSCLVHFNAL